MELAVASSVGLCSVSVASVAAYRLLRPLFSVSVNCHFCNGNFKVNHSQRNSWRCPECDQYNGWTEDGDYNTDLDLTGNSAKRFVSDQTRSTSSNGLCRTCNLNQELKVSQLSRQRLEGPELAEYCDHLEKVYRLCPHCEDLVSGVLAEQDRGLAANVLQWRLENSRLNSSRQQKEKGGRLVSGLEQWLSMAVLASLQDFSPLSVPGCLLNIDTTSLSFLFPNFTVGESLAQLLSSLLPLLLLILITSLTLLSSLHRRPLRTLLYLLLLCLVWADLRPGFQLVVAVLAMLSSPSSSPSPAVTPVKERSPVCVLTPPPAQTEEELETKTQDLLSSSDENLTVSPTNRSAPIRSTTEISFNHEFSTSPGQQRDCDLSSLSIEDLSTGSPSVRSAPTFQLRSYSPSSSSNSLFSPNRPLLRPARLTSTSWVAGGYWTPPVLSPGPPLSRASSQSSGFISATPSLANYNYPHQLQTTPSHSVFSEPRPGPLNLRRRTVEDSISDSSCERPGRDQKDKREAENGWTFTVTITPTGLLLAASIIINITLAVLWCSQ